MQQMSWYDTILSPIMTVVAWIMVNIHNALDAIGINKDVAWVASIVALVVFMRALLIPLFVKQIRASRGLQLIQPELQRIQKKYKGKTDPASRQKMTEETMALYRQSGTNPMSSCWPVLLQSPIFFALFRVLNSLPAIRDGQYPSIGPLNSQVAASAESATLFGAPLSSTFMKAADFAPYSPVTIRIVTVVLIVLMSVTTFTTQRQLTMKNMPQSALDNPMARQQKMLVYMMPFIFFISGPNFPIGVLIYWLTTNLWSMGQQFFVIRRMPAPGSEAERRMKERKARRHPGSSVLDDDGENVIEQGSGQRQQPMGKARAKKKGVRQNATSPESGKQNPGETAGDGSSGKDDDKKDQAAEVSKKDRKGPSVADGSSNQAATREGAGDKSSEKQGPKNAAGNRSKKKKR